MIELILHHYLESTFSEKVRALLNAKRLPWRSVIVPPIMPRPDTMPLTGGYRRIPLLQVGADVYCDTSLIAAYLDDKGEGEALYPEGSRAAAQALARWVETELIWSAATLRFQPSNIGLFFPSSEAAEAFARDRAAFGLGAPAMRQVPLEEALPRYQLFLGELNAQLSDGRRYIFGAAWTIADFSTYHMVWFIHAGGGLGDLLAQHRHVKSWLKRIREFSVRPGESMGDRDAIDIAMESAPRPLQGVSELEGIPVGMDVDVAPIDYGVMPSQGKLLHCDTREIVIGLHHARTGNVHVHFPRLGFGVRRQDNHSIL